MNFIFDYYICFSIFTLIIKKLEFIILKKKETKYFNFKNIVFIDYLPHFAILIYY